MARPKTWFETLTEEQRTALDAEVEQMIAEGRADENKATLRFTKLLGRLGQKEKRNAKTTG